MIILKEGEMILDDAIDIMESKQKRGTSGKSF
jgi:hypothetical protein